MRGRRCVGVGAVLVWAALLGGCQKYGGVSPEDPDEPPAGKRPEQAARADDPGSRQAEARADAAGPAL